LTLPAVPGPATTGPASDEAPGALPLANARHELFCQEYLKDANGTRSAIAASFKAQAAASQASRLLKTPKVAARVAWLRAQRVKGIEMTLQEADDALSGMVRFDLRKAASWGDGNMELVASDALDDLTALSLVEVVEETKEVRGDEGAVHVNRKRKVKGPDKLAALALFYRRHGLVDGGGQVPGQVPPGLGGLTINVLVGPGVPHPPQQKQVGQVIGGVMVLSHGNGAHP
jgi:phage terminase small subunit